MLEKINYKVEKIFSSMKFVFLKKIGWSGMIHQRGYTRKMIKRKKFFQKMFFLKKMFSQKNFITLLSVVVRLTVDRKQKLHFGENIFFLNFVLLKKELIVLVGFFNGVYRNDFKNKNYNLEDRFFKKRTVFLQSTVLNDIFISAGKGDWCWKLKFFSK